MFDARLGDQLLCTSTIPFLDAARALLAEGADPDATLVMLHAGIESLRGRIGYAARFTVSESAGSPRLVRWAPHPGRGIFAAPAAAE
jgi:hypothetical protein